MTSQSSHSWKNTFCSDGCHDPPTMFTTENVKAEISSERGKEAATHMSLYCCYCFCRTFSVWVPSIAVFYLSVFNTHISLSAGAAEIVSSAATWVGLK